MILPHQEDLKDHRPRCWRCRKRVSWFKVYDGPRGGKLCGDCSLSAAAVEVAEALEQLDGEARGRVLRAVAVLLGIKGGLGAP